MKDLIINKIFSIWHPSRVFFRPRELYIETSKLCNLACRHCARTNLGQLNALGYMSFENFKKIIKQFPKLKKIKLYGLGEPFMNPDIFRMADYLKERYRRIYLDITTNGTLLTHEICQKIIIHKIDHVNISLDTDNKKTYKLIRGIDYFDKIIRNIKYLIELKNKIGSPLIVSTAFVVQKRNITELIGYIKLVKLLGVDYASMQDLNLAWIDDADKKDIDFNEYSCSIRQAQDYAKQIDLKFCYSRNPRPKKNRKYVCPSPFVGDITITWDGYVTPCCMISNPDIINFGNVFEEDFGKIFNNKKFIRFRKDLSSDNNIPFFCRKCSLVRRE